MHRSHIICNISQVLQGAGNGCCCRFNGPSYWNAACLGAGESHRLLPPLGVCCSVFVCICGVLRWCCHVWMLQFQCVKFPDEKTHICHDIFSSRSYTFSNQFVFVRATECHVGYMKMHVVVVRLRVRVWSFASWLFCSLDWRPQLFSD